MRIDRHAIFFYLGIPAALGFVFGLSEAGSQPFSSMSGHLAYWLISTIGSWQVLALGSLAVSYLLKPIGVPLPVVLVVGFYIGLETWLQMGELRNSLLTGFVPDGQVLRDPQDSTDLSAEISNQLLGLSLWVSANYFHFYFFGISRFRYVPDADRVKRFRNWLLNLGASEETQIANLGDPSQPVSSTDSSTPRLLERLSSAGKTEILALKAEDHYTRVYTPDREHLIYVMFKEAIKEMDNRPGLQVHRSYWVCSDAIETYMEKGHKANVRLKNGQDIPVSRSFRQTIKASLKPQQETSELKAS